MSRYVGHQYIALTCLLLCAGGTLAPTVVVADSPLIATREQFRCTINADQKLECFGSSSPILSIDDFPDLDAGTFSQVSTSSNHACAVRSNGMGLCWGENGFGTNDVPTDVQFQALFAGTYHTCGLTVDNGIQCWGGVVDFETDAPEGNNFVQLTGLRTITCALDDRGVLSCWGHPESVEAQYGAAAGKRYQHISPYCGLSVEGDIDCWNAALSSGVGGNADDPFVAVTSSLLGVCGLRASGSLQCERISSNNVSSSRFAAIINAPEYNGIYTQVEIGNRYLCAASLDREWMCWGEDNSLGQITPIPAFSASDFSATVYGPTVLELSWQDETFTFNRYQVVRDGVTLVDNFTGKSFLDESFDASNGATRYQLITKRWGRLDSDPIEIVVNGSATEDNSHTVALRVMDPLNLRYEIYSNTAAELFWNHPADVSNLAGYEIRRNGQFLFFTSGISHFDDTLMTDVGYLYEITTMDSDGNAVGFAAQYLRTDTRSECRVSG